MPWSAFSRPLGIAEWSNIELIHAAMAESRNWLQRLEEKRSKPEAAKDILETRREGRMLHYHRYAWDGI